MPASLACALPEPTYVAASGLDAMLQQTVAYHGARGFGERGEFSERFLGRGLRGLGGLDHTPTSTTRSSLHFTVFDFGDVLDLAQTRHMLQCVAGFAFLPLFVVGFAEVARRLSVSSSTSDWSASTPPGRRLAVMSLLDIVVLAQWHSLTVKLWCLYYHHCLETWASRFRHVDGPADTRVGCRRTNVCKEMEHGTGRTVFRGGTASKDVRRTLHVTLRGNEADVEVSNGVFSGNRAWIWARRCCCARRRNRRGRATFLDLGCGWGPIALTLGFESPEGRRLGVGCQRARA